MIANEEYEAALADMKNFCAKETTFDVEFLTNVYPLVAVFKPKAQRSLFDSENYNVDENGEIGSIQIAFGTTTKVQSSLRFKMDAKLLKKFIKLTEKVGLLYLHAFFENQAAGTYEAWQAAQADAALKAAAIKQTAEDARARTSPVTASRFTSTTCSRTANRTSPTSTTRSPAATSTKSRSSRAIASKKYAERKTSPPARRSRSRCSATAARSESTATKAPQRGTARRS